MEVPRAPVDNASGGPSFHPPIPPSEMVVPPIILITPARPEFRPVYIIFLGYLSILVIVVSLCLMIS